MPDGVGPFCLPMKRIKTIDAEVAGEAVRLVVDGAPSIPGRTMAEKLRWARTHADDLRQRLMLEPRGHAGMHGAMFSEPVSPGSHAGLLSMHAAGFPIVSGEGIIAAVTIAIEHKLIEGAGDEVRVDTPAGLFRARLGAMGAMGATGAMGAIVAVTGVPSFVHSPGVSVRVGSRNVTVDIAFGGELYAIADSEAIGIPIEMANAASLIRIGRDIKSALDSSVHIHGTIFTGAPRAAADLRSATVLDGEVLRRSPGATGTAALMAVLDAMGLLLEGSQFTHEGVLGTTLRASVADRAQTNGMPAVVPVIEGAASITGFHEFVI